MKKEKRVRYDILKQIEVAITAKNYKQVSALTQKLIAIRQRTIKQ